MADESSSKWSQLLGGVGVDLSKRLVEMVDQVADAIHNKAVRPVLLVVRAVVFSSVILTLSALIGVVFVIAVVRLLTVDAFSGRVWLSDLTAGGGAMVLGLVLWSFRRSRRFRT